MSTWDVRTQDGHPVATLAGLASALFTTREGAAKQLLADPVLIEGAPEPLVAEAKSMLTPGSPTAPRRERDAAAVLVATVAAQDTRCSYLNLPEHARVTGQAVKSVYDRGVQSWPGAGHTTLSAQEWALGRVEHFVKVADGSISTKSAVGHDADLLHPGHPMAEEQVVHVDAAEVEAQIKGLTFAGADQVVHVDASDVEQQIAALTEGID